MFIHRLARTRPLYTLLPRVPRRSDLSLTVMHWQACSGWCPPTSAPHRLLILPQIFTDLSVAQNVPQSPTGCVLNIFSSQPHSSIYLYLDGSRPPRTPPNLQSQTTGNLAVFGFAFSPFSLTPSPLVPCCIILSLTFAGAHARSFLIIFRVAEAVTFPRPLDRTAAST